MQHDECAAAIEAFASAEPARIRALPARCTLDDATRTLKALGATSRGQLGKERDVGLDVHYFASEKLKEIHAWVDQTGHIVLLDVELPPGSNEAYRKSLGEPEATLERHELVWPSKGAVVVEGNGSPMRVGVFAPTTLAQYEAQLRYVEHDTDE